MNDRRRGLVDLEVPDAPAVFRFLRQEPEHNVYLLTQLARGALESDEVAGPVLGYYGPAGLEGVAIIGSNLALSFPSSEQATLAVADHTREGRYLVRVVVGEDRVIDRFATAYDRNLRHIGLERGGQVLYRVTASRLAAPAHEVALRCADAEDLEALVATDHHMVVEELGFDPFLADPEGHRAGWQRRIREGRAWLVGPIGGPVAFKAEHSSGCDDAIQISGVWTDPDQRRRGLAAAGLAQLSEVLLELAPSVTLYVNADNVPALGLYRRLGFEDIGRVRAIWFDD